MSKGARAEEVVRRFFRDQGGFVIRSVELRFSDEPVTDIDLWVFGGSGALRETTVVDCKNKQVPKALERVLWVVGLQKQARATHAIVATTDRRSVVVRCAERLGVQVLGGAKMQELLDAGEDPSRIPEEDLLQALRIASPPSVDLALRYEQLKTACVVSGPFGALVTAIEAFRLPAQRFVAASVPGALRLAYWVCAAVCLCADRCVAGLSLLPAQSALAQFRDGVRFGDGGRASMMDRVDAAAQLVLAIDSSASAIAANLRSGTEKYFEQVDEDARGLTELLLRPAIVRRLLSLASEFESAAFAVDMPSGGSLSIDAQALLGAMCDLAGVSRARFLS